MRLIDADKLIELCNIMAKKRDGIGKSIWEQFATTVEWSPTVDAEPVRHGRWIGNGFLSAKCSVCNTEVHDMEVGYYCPNCGAKMDGEERR